MSRHPARNPVLRPFADEGTYRGLLFLLTAVPLGAAWLAITLAGWLAISAVAITPLVVLVIVGFSEVVRLMARAEGAIARSLLGTLTYPPRTAEPRAGLLRRAGNVLADPSFWKIQTYLFLRILLGSLVALVELVLLAGGLFSITAPIHYRWIPQEDGERGIDFGVRLVDTFGESLLLVPAGLVLALAGVHLVGPFTELWRALAYALLGGRMTNVDTAALSERALRRGLAIHAAVSGGISAVLIVIWALTARAYFWPAWPMLPLGLFLAVHGVVTLLLVRPDLAPRRLGRGFAMHVGVSASIVLFLTGIWGMAGGGYFWPVWPALGLTVIALVHLLVAAVGSPTNAELEKRIDVLTSTRSGAVDAQEAELRRIERDLHDGAQARLVALGMNLGMAEQKLAIDPDAARQLVVEAKQGAREALEELRDLTRGIHPPVLVDRGLRAAVSALAARSPVEVRVSVIGERPPAPVESAAYFVVAEALANATKHANAARVDIRVTRAHDRLTVEVTDDGSGGADPAGPGLSGLRQRVEALDGTLLIDSPPGGPTVVRAELPCAS